MKNHITCITLGVDDLKKALAFYRDGMGLKTKGIVGEEYEDGAVVFFDMNAGLTLALFPRASLAKDANISVSGRSASEFSISHNVGSKQEVDAMMQQAARAGARIVAAAGDKFWGGYAGYFQDLDGHLWEVAWNPKWPFPS
jgi:uncharacterized glyoxalase superfamily protein PhnB